MQKAASRSDLGLVIAKRSVSLSRTYPIIGAFLACLSALILNVPQLTRGETLSVNSTGLLEKTALSSISYIAVPLQVFAALIFSTPVLLLYVYDKNNGVLEYFLSLGMDQGDIYQQYLKAALTLSGTILAFEIVLNIAVGVIVRTSSSVIFSVALLTVLIALPVVSLTTIAMIAFSSLQKQRVGSNQPLGIAIGAFAVLPTYIIPLVIPSFVVLGDLLLAVSVILLSLALFFLSSKLISREKFLP